MESPTIPPAPAVPVAAAPPSSPVGDQITKLIPEYMAELAKQFIEQKDLSSRQKIRRRVRAVLDLFSADTKWPNGQPEPQGPRVRGGGMFAQAPMAGFGGRGERPADDLVEPPQVDAVPVPGAEVAEGQMGG